MLNLRATARNINLIILITKDEEGCSVSPMPYKYRYRPPVFARVQSAKVVRSDSFFFVLFIIPDFYLVSMRFLFPRYVYYSYFLFPFANNYTPCR